MRWSISYFISVWKNKNDVNVILLKYLIGIIRHGIKEAIILFNLI
ncbi:hypothetical protein GJA_3923 [Janthinobacterium agaricidamnosum NBRC 102515 = DSM 9628]|uniref:Uncharacterized protein n=1 Tax=Janthinobacterium agaricidamnosum NBRC 102515 = DSM 9628 TaxID=1349767 RepID=W0V6T3_9BURK|nr:hypothetical protein GJA_3923 [Janthinobacterium agaricidamnosum NBRC 102515 = DSM 9628]